MLKQREKLCVTVTKEKPRQSLSFVQAGEKLTAAQLEAIAGSGLPFN